MTRNRLILLLGIPSALLALLGLAAARIANASADFYDWRDW